jgi:hypothetical protein
MRLSKSRRIALFKGHDIEESIRRDQIALLHAMESAGRKERLAE